MTSAKRTIRAAKLQLVAVIAALILMAALAPLLILGLDYLLHGRAFLLFYLGVIIFPAILSGSALYRLAFRPASPARHTLDRLLGMFCVAICGLTVLTAIAPDLPHDVASSVLPAFLMGTILFVALVLCGFYWPLDPQGVSSQPTRRTLSARIPRWVWRVLLLPLVVAPLPLAIWFTRIDWLTAPAHSTEYYMPQYVELALLTAMTLGYRQGERIPARAPRPVLPAEALDWAAFESAMKRSGAAASEMGVLLSRSATTGWWDWLHGELWLFPHGILRVPLGWPMTLASAGGFYDARSPTVRSVDISDFTHLITDPRNLWVPRDAIAFARLGHTLGAGELRVKLSDGRQLRLLWLPSQAVYQRLSVALREWLGERLEAR